MNIRKFAITDQQSVITLWERCGLVRPWNDPSTDILRKVATDPEGFLVLEENGQIIASVMAGYDGHRGWINYLAVSPDMQRCGIGARLIDYAEQHLEQRGCPKINLQIRAQNTDVIEFYNAIGYSEDPVISMGKRLIADD